jgi:hypothetical protein
MVAVDRLRRQAPAVTAVTAAVAITLFGVDPAYVGGAIVLEGRTSRHDGGFALELVRQCC